MTPAEKNVYDLVLTGESNQSIANTLGITEKTVKFHLTSIFKQHAVKSRAQLINKQLTLKSLENSANLIATVQSTLSDLAKIEEERRFLVTAQTEELRATHRSKTEIEEALKNTFIKMHIVPEGNVAMNMKAMFLGALGL